MDASRTAHVANKEAWCRDVVDMTKTGLMSLAHERLRAFWYSARKEKHPIHGCDEEGKIRMTTLAIRRTTLATALLPVFCMGSGALAENMESKGKMTRIHVTVGDAVLPANLDDTTAGRDFAAMLPLELSLSDYHGIEKVADLPGKIDTSDAPASYKPETGDITLYAPWGNLAIFYKPFQDSRGLVRLGAFDGPIDALLKEGTFPVRIELAD